MNRLNRILCLVSGCIVFLIGSGANSQEFPSRPIRIIVPFAAGSGTDAMGRIVGQKMAENTGQQVIVDNRPGLNGVLGTEAAAKAAPDGYTIVLGGSGNFGINMVLYSKLPYDSQKDFAPIVHFGVVNYWLLVRKDMPINSVKQFVDSAKANPGKRTIAYASSSTQMAGELFRYAAGLDVTMVPYKSLSQELADLASGEVDAAFLDSSAALPQIQAGGRLKALAVTAPERSALMPAVPTFAESGYPTVASQAWNAFFAPAGTPPEIVAKLHTEIMRAAQTKDIQEKFLNMGMEPVNDSTPERLRELLNSDIVKWAKLFKDANLPKNN